MNFEFFQGSHDTNYPELRSLPQDTVHVWQFPLNISSSDVTLLRPLLAEDEISRASRFRAEGLRNNFIFGRATLRRLLASYSGQPARKFSFAYNETGKPGMPPADESSITFNVSHSGNLIVFALTLRRRIGVDVELVRKDFNVEKIADRFFSAAERQSLHDLPEHERYDAFFRCWTRKEAFIKASGKGLSHPLHLFDVSLVPETDCALLATRPVSSDTHRWTLRSIPVAPGYVAALAVETLPAGPLD